MNERPEPTLRVIIEGIVVTLLFVGLLFLISPDLAWEIIELHAVAPSPPFPQAVQVAATSFGRT
jgi:hypothetical protein